MALNFALFVGRLSICAHLEHDRLHECFQNPQVCLDLSLDKNDVTASVIESTLLSSTVGVMAQVVILIHLAKRTKTSKALATTFIVIATTLSTYAFGFSVKQVWFSPPL